MKRSKFSEEQVAYALRQAESGTVVGDVCRQVGISEATFYAWKKKYAHLGVNEVRRLRQLEEENTRLKRLVADLSLDKHMLSEALRKKSEAHTSPRAGQVVPRHVSGQLCAGLPTGAVQSRGLVSKESSQGSNGAAPAHPRTRARASALRVLTYLGLASPRGLACQQEARAATVSARGPAAANACATPETSSPASRPGAGSDGAARTLEHGFCARCPGRWPAFSHPDGGRSVESPQSVTGGGGAPVRTERGRGPRSCPPGATDTVLDHRRSWHRVLITCPRRLGVSPRRPTRLHSAGQTRRKRIH